MSTVNHHSIQTKLSKKTLIFPVLLCAILWGSAFPGIKGIYEDWSARGVPSDTKYDLYARMLLAGVRFSIAGMALLLLSKSPLKDWKASPKRRVIEFAIFQTFLQYIFFYWALSVSSATLGGLLASAGSFWWVLLAPIMIKSAWPNRYQWALLGVGAIGVALAVYKPGHGSEHTALGACLFLASTLCGSIGILTLPKLTKTMGSRCATGYGLFIGGMALMLCGFPAWQHFPTLFSPKVWMLTAYLAFVSAAAFALWNYLSTLFPVNLLAGYRFIIPICAVIESALFVKGETLGWGIFAGGLLVIISIIGLKRHQNK